MVSASQSVPLASKYAELAAVISMESIPKHRANCKSQYSHLHAAKSLPDLCFLGHVFPAPPLSHPSGETQPIPLSPKTSVTLFFSTEDFQGDWFCYPADNNPLVAHTISGYLKGLSAKTSSILGGECIWEPHGESSKHCRKNPF